MLLIHLKRAKLNERGEREGPKGRLVKKRKTRKETRSKGKIKKNLTLISFLISEPFCASSLALSLSCFFSMVSAIKGVLIEW